MEEWESGSQWPYISITQDGRHSGQLFILISSHNGSPNQLTLSSPPLSLSLSLPLGRQRERARARARAREREREKKRAEARERERERDKSNMCSGSIWPQRHPVTFGPLLKLLFSRCVFKHTMWSGGPKRRNLGEEGRGSRREEDVYVKGTKDALSHSVSAKKKKKKGKIYIDNQFCFAATR